VSVPSIPAADQPPRGTTRGRPEARTLAALAVIVAATWIAYWPCLAGGFIWDDNSYVAYNPLLLDTTGLWRIWLEPTATPQYHPLVFSSFWIEYQAWGTATAGYHIVNVALHTVNTLLLWVVLQRLRVPGAVLAAGIFALHPVHVESVAWITERKDVLSAFFYGLTMLWWLHFLETRRERDWLIALAFGACTLLSKTVLCTLPAALALVALWQAPHQWRHWGARLFPFVLIAAPIAAVTVWREHAHGNPALPYTLLERALIASRALWTHVGMLVWPVGLTIVYARWDVSTADPWAYLFPLAGLGVLAVLLALRPRYGTGPLVAVAFFLVTLSPMVGFVDYNIMRYAFVADHFQYIAGAGLIALAAAAAHRCTADLRPGFRIVLATVVLTVLGILSWRQAGLYADADVIWRDNVAKNPRSWIGYTYLATEMMRANETEAAAKLLAEAVERMPENAEAKRTLGIVIASLGRPQEALEHLTRAVDLDPAQPQAQNSLGAVLLSMGRVEQAEEHFATAARLKPDYAEAWYHRAIATAQQGKRNEAIAYLQEALRLRPDYPEARAQLDSLVGEHGGP
jgi:tetratricopeptide (TPR) repeat protein